MLLDHQRERILQRRAKLRDADRATAEIRKGFEARRIGLVRSDDADATEPRMIGGRAADDSERALVGENEERVGETGRAKINLAAGDRNGDRLRGFERY